MWQCMPSSPTITIRAISLWALGIHWEAFATGAAQVAVDAYMAHKRGQCAREAMEVLLQTVLTS